ncbi:MAG: sulfur carrier protein ThiS [Actinomycetota bacterium]|nr:sulfur carrier protein ThiS [Actinomycetota bacterium]
MKVVLNGERRELPAEATVADAVLLTGASQPTRGIAVAVDGEVVPNGGWAERRLSEGESVEVVHAVQGG